MARAFNAFTSKLRRWLGDNTAKRAENRKLPAKPATRRLAVEHLEDRVVPAPLNYSQIASTLSSQVRSLASNNSFVNALSNSTGDLPLLGKSFQSQMQNAQTAVNTASTTILNNLNSLATNTSTNAIRSALFNAKVVGDTDGNGKIEEADVQIANNFNPTLGNLEITMALSYTYQLAGTTFAFNLGLPGLPFGLAATSRLGLDVNVGFNQLKFGARGGTAFIETVGQNNTFTIELAAKAVGTSVQGTMGFFSITGTAMKLPNGQPGRLPAIQLNAGLRMYANNFTLTAPTMIGNAQMNLTLDARFDPSLNSGTVTPASTFPHLVTDFQMNWGLNGSSTGTTNQLGSAPTVQFNNIQFGVGTYLGSMVAPIADIVQQVTAPLEPVFELLAARLPGLSDLSEPLGLGPITLEKLSSVAIAAGVLPPDYQFMAELGYNLHMLVKTLRSANLTAGDVLIPMGSFDLGGNGDLRRITLTNGATSLNDWANKLKALEQFDPSKLEDFADLTKLVPRVTDTVDSIESRIHTLNFGPAQRAVDAAFTQIKTQLAKLQNGIGLSFPLIEDPTSVYKLFLGQDVDFVKLDAKFVDTASKSGSLKVWGPIDAGFSGNIRYALELHAGVDTFGLRAFFVDLIRSDARRADLSLLDDGLYVDSSKELARINGRIKANAGISQTFGAGLQLFAYAGLEGEIETPRDFVLKFVDPNQRGDHKLRLLKSGEVGSQLFLLDASLTARFKFVVEAGVRVNLVFTDVEKKYTVFSYDLGKQELFDSNKIDTRNPFLNPIQNDEPIDVIYDANFQNGANDGGDDTIRVRATTNWLYVYHNGVSTRYRLRNVNSLRIVGSDDNEEITIEGSVRNFGVTVDGGLGSNTLYFDDSAFNTGNGPRYFLSAGRVSRTGTTNASAPTSTSIAYSNMDALVLTGSESKKGLYTINSVAIGTTIYGGGGDDTFNIASSNHSLDGLLNRMAIFGGGGFNKLTADDSGDDQRAMYSVGSFRDYNEKVLERRTFTSLYSELQNRTFIHELSYEALEFFDIGLITIRGTNNGNIFDVIDEADPEVPKPLSVDIYAGRGADVVNVIRTTNTTNIYGQSGSDVVNVGVPAWGTRLLYGDVSVDNTGGFTTLNVIDSSTTTNRTVLLDATTSGDRGFIYGLTRTPVGGFGQSRISFKAADTAAVNVLGGSGNNTFSVGDTARRGGVNDLRTTITAGSGINSVYVDGTNGALTVVGGGPLSGVVIGAFPNDTGDLGRIKAPVTVLGRVSGLTITDSGASGRMGYTMDASHFSRTNLRNSSTTGTVYYGQVSMTGLNVTMGNGGSVFTIDGTPTLVSGFNSGVNVYTGNGSDAGKVLATSGPLTLDLGSGGIQSVTIGDGTHSLDAISNGLGVVGGGSIDAYVDDTATTQTESVRITAGSGPFGEYQTVERSPFTSEGSGISNSFGFRFRDRGRLTYTSGGGVTTLSGTPRNAPVILNGGASTDIFIIEPGTTGLQSYVDVNGNAGQNDFAYYNDASTATPKNYTLRGDGNYLVVERTGAAPVTYFNMTEIIATTASVGGNQVRVQSTPQNLTLNLEAARGDTVRVGGNMSVVRGAVTVAGGSNVTLVVDDTAGPQGRGAILHEGLNGGGFITGMGPGRAAWNLGEGSSVNVSGGRFNDTFAIERTRFASAVRVDGGAGVNTLDFTTVEQGVRVYLPLGTATGLAGGIARIQNVVGSPFDDILVGNGGNVLTGLSGRDILVAGRTPSTLNGGNGEDILIGGILYADDGDGLMNPEAIEAAAAEWSRFDADYATRANNLRGMLAGSVIRNGGRNTLLGQSEADLFFTSGIDVGDWFEGEVQATG